MARLDSEEKCLLNSFERGGWQSIEGHREAFERYRDYAHMTVKKDRRVNIRISCKDLEALRKRAIEAAMNFYTSIFKNSKVGNVIRYGDAGPGPKGAVTAVTLDLEGQEFMALNGGPMFTFSPAISFFVHCETQEEVDELWAKLSEGGETRQCGWLKDKYEVSWQVVPTVLGTMLQDKDAEKSTRVMEAMPKMDKLDIKLLKQAYDQR